MGLGENQPECKRELPGYNPALPCHRTATWDAAGGFTQKESVMRHYEIILLIHPDQSEQVPAMLERYKA